MNELSEALRRRADVGPGRGASAIYAAAATESSRRQRARQPRRLAVLALIVFVGLVAIATMWATGATRPPDSHAVAPPPPSLPPPSTIDTSSSAPTTFTDPDAGFTVELP